MLLFPSVYFLTSLVGNTKAAYLRFSDDLTLRLSPGAPVSLVVPLNELFVLFLRICINTALRLSYYGAKQSSLYSFSHALIRLGWQRYRNLQNLCNVAAAEHSMRCGFRYEFNYNSFTQSKLYIACTMVTSCEPKRTKAYSEDIRWRMVYQLKLLGKTYSEIASNLNVDASTVYRIISLFDTTGDVRPKQYPSNTGTVRLTDIDKFIILVLVVDKPGIYLREIQQQLAQDAGTEVDTSTICRFLHSSGFTRQKLVITAKQRSDELRAEYMSDMTVYLGHPEFLVFVDETGTDRRDYMRRFGYSMRGKPARTQKLLWRGERNSHFCSVPYWDTGLLHNKGYCQCR